MIDTVAIKREEKATMMLTLSLTFKEAFQVITYKQWVISIAKLILKVKLTFSVKK